MIKYNECPACGSQDLINSGKPINCSSDSKYSVIKCQNCSLQWCDPMPTKEDLDTYYNIYYEIRYNTVDKYPLKTKIRSLLTFRAARLKSFFKLIEKYSPANSILDFGCGEAKILYIAKEKNWKILGVDYSSELKGKFKMDEIEFKQGSDLYSIDIEKNSFGCISAKHVIEHIPNIPKFLQSIKDYLTANGIIAAKTPSASSLRAKFGLADWHLVKPPEHFWGFNIENFRKLFERNGFQIIYLKDNLFVDELTCIAKAN